MSSLLIRCYPGPLARALRRRVRGAPRGAPARAVRRGGHPPRCPRRASSDARASGDERSSKGFHHDAPNRRDRRDPWCRAPRLGGGLDHEWRHRAVRHGPGRRGHVRPPRRARRGQRVPGTHPTAARVDRVRVVRLRDDHEPGRGPWTDGARGPVGSVGGAGRRRPRCSAWSPDWSASRCSGSRRCRQGSCRGSGPSCSPSRRSCGSPPSSWRSATGGLAWWLVIAASLAFLLGWLIIGIAAIRLDQPATGPRPA